MVGGADTSGNATERRAGRACWLLVDALAGSFASSHSCHLGMASVTVCAASFHAAFAASPVSQSPKDPSEGAIHRGAPMEGVPIAHRRLHLCRHLRSHRSICLLPPSMIAPTPPSPPRTPPLPSPSLLSPLSPAALADQAPSDPLPLLPPTSPPCPCLRLCDCLQAVAATPQGY